MTVATRQVGWSVLIQWVVATTAAFSLNASLIEFVERNLIQTSSEAIAFMLLGATLAVVAFVPGSLQTLILRKWLPRAGRWFLLSGVGSFLGFLSTVLGMNLAIGAVGGEDGSVYIMFPAFGLAFASAGALAEAFEWNVLRKRVPRASWWV